MLVAMKKLFDCLVLYAKIRLSQISHICFC